MKRAIALLMAFVLALGLFGCSNTENIAVPAEDEEHWALIPMVMVDGVLYFDTGRSNTATHQRETFDGEITASVGAHEKPTANDQSNFGTGYGYQYGETEGTIEVYLNEKWRIFAAKDAEKQVQSPNE